MLDTNLKSDTAEHFALECKNISKSYSLNTGFARSKHEELLILNQLSFSLQKGHTLGLVGPSGCGKSSLARIVTGLSPANSGTVHIDGKLMQKPRDFIGKVQMVFQNPFSSLNPKLKIGYTLQEALLLKLKREKKQYTKEFLAQEVKHVLEKVGLEFSHAKKFPHEFSGGQRQRIAIARALITKPTLLVCDEALSALDVSIQAQILNLLKDLSELDKLSMLFISHDMNVIALISDEILELKVQGKI